MLDGSRSWLADDVLLLVSDPEGDYAAATNRGRQGYDLALDAQSMRLPASRDSGKSRSGPLLQVVLLPEGIERDEAWASRSTTSGAETVTATREEVEQAAIDLRPLILNHLAPLDAATRNLVTDFLASATAERAGLALSAKLAEIRAALRERLPEQQNSPDAPRGLVLDHVLALDERSFYLKGWAHDEEEKIVRLTAVSPEGARVELRDRLFRYPRPDVVEWSNVFSSQSPEARLGMICFFEMDPPNLLTGPWVFEMENAKGTAVEFPVTLRRHDVEDVRSTILEDCAADELLDDRLMAEHLSPAMARLQALVDDPIETAKVVQHGQTPESPEVSIVVPVYRSIEHLEAQLAEFADDPAIHGADLIYVLDSPEQADAFKHLAAHLFPIYRIPFRIVILERNLGFAGASNAGASVARGRLLLLLNSDVLPDKSRWLETMCEFYDSKPSIGALGPKLIYEDDSIQHAGMYFYRPPGSSLWQDSHYYRGLHRTFPEANVTRPVPAVSGACLMIDRGLYKEVGGLSGHYVRGDYEDFDICLRLIEAGRENWYLPEAELYHLEGQSYAPELREPANHFNVWLHTHLWRERIDELMESDELRASTNTSMPSRGERS